MCAVGNLFFIAPNGSGLKEVADLTDKFHYEKRK